MMAAGKNIEIMKKLEKYNVHKWFIFSEIMPGSW